MVFEVQQSYLGDVQVSTYLLAIKMYLKPELEAIEVTTLVLFFLHFEFNNPFQKLEICTDATTGGVLYLPPSPLLNI